MRDRINMYHSPSRVFRETPRWKNKKEGINMYSFYSFFSPSTGKWLQKVEVSGILPEQDCAVILTVKLLKRKDKTVSSTIFPNKTNSSWFSKQEIFHKFLYSPYSHWQFSHGYKTLCRSKIKLKGQHEKIIHYLHEKISKSSSKEN